MAAETVIILAEVKTPVLALLAELALWKDRPPRTAGRRHAHPDRRELTAVGAARPGRAQPRRRHHRLGAPT